MQCNARHRPSSQWHELSQSEDRGDQAPPIRDEVSAPSSMNCTELHTLEESSKAEAESLV